MALPDDEYDYATPAPPERPAARWQDVASVVLMVIAVLGIGATLFSISAAAGALWTFLVIGVGGAVLGVDRT